MKNWEHCKWYLIKNSNSAQQWTNTFRWAVVGPCCGSFCSSSPPSRLKLKFYPEWSHFTYMSLGIEDIESCMDQLGETSPTMGQTVASWGDWDNRAKPLVVHAEGNLSCVGNGSSLLIFSQLIYFLFSCTTFRLLQLHVHLPMCDSNNPFMFGTQI